MLVIDASVAVKCFISEEDTDKAEKILLSGQRLLAPELISIEVAAAFTRLQRTGEISIEIANILLQKWRGYLKNQAVFLHQISIYQSQAEQLSIELSHPLQDCLYLAVSSQLEIPLVTADNKFLSKAQTAGYNVVSL